MTDSTSPALKVTGVSKSFGGAQALDGVGLTIDRGEIHGLLGENGSGKSTLIKVLSGFHAPDAGSLEIYGHSVPLPMQPGEFRKLGLEFVHQDLGLIPSLTVVENLRLTEFATGPNEWRLPWSAYREEAGRAFDRYGLRIDPAARVGDLRAVDRALVAIVRAVETLRRDAATDDRPGVLVLDEPTVFLPRAGVLQLFDLVRGIAADGGSVLFVSHDLDEVRELTHRLTVLRDGRGSGTVVTAEPTASQLVEMIIGRKLDPTATKPSPASESDRDIRLAVDNLSGEILDGVSLSLRKGEVLGVTGLAGSGFDELPYLLFGAGGCLSGHGTVDGEQFDWQMLLPHAAINAGMALIPADRQTDGSLGSLSIIDNISVNVLDSYQRRGMLRRRRMERDAARLMDEYDVRPRLPRLTYSALSGGNQQKVLLAKWLRTEPTILLLHEPTQGVDVGAREQIYQIIRQAAAAGAAVLCASSDYDQLSVLCHRVLIVSRGHFIHEVEDAEVTKERITELCYGSATLTRPR